MQTKSNLLDATSHKINDKIDIIGKLRKEIINYTNNYREFKLLKSDIIERFLDNENDLRQLSTIIKSVTNQNYVQNETIQALQQKIDNLDNLLKNSEKDNIKLKSDIEEQQKKINSLTITNQDKDIFIHDLLSKINFLENVIRDYQKRIYISKYDKMFSYKSPFKNEELIKNFYDKLLPKEYKFLNFPYYLLNMKNSYNIISSKITDEEKGSPIENKKRESIVTLLKNRPKSSNPLINSVNSDDKKIKNLNNNINILNSNEELDILSNNNFSIENIKTINKNENNKNSSNILLSSMNNLNNVQQTKNTKLSNSLQFDNEELIKKNLSSSNGAFSIKSPNNNVNNLYSNKVKTSLEKERANQVSDLLLKIFSSSNISKTLKRKFGENFEINLTDKEADPNFIRLVDNEVNELLNEEKDRKNLIKDRMEVNRMGRSNAGRMSSARAISPDNYYEKENYNRNKKSFNNFTKNNIGYFNPKLQYGGESCVPGSTRTRSNDRNSINSMNKRKESKNRLSIEMKNKQYLFKEEGWNTLKDFFTNDK